MTMLAFRRVLRADEKRFPVGQFNPEAISIFHRRCALIGYAILVQRGTHKFNSRLQRAATRRLSRRARSSKMMFDTSGTVLRDV